MLNPGIHSGVSFADYLADPAPEPSAQSGTIRDLLSAAPRQVWQNTRRLNPDCEENNDTKFDLGKVTHTLFTGEGEPLMVIDAKDYRSAAAKEQRAAALEAGKSPILAHQLDGCSAMATAAQEIAEANPDLPPLDAFQREQSMIWEEAGVYCRSRPDFWSAKHNTILHFKTTSVEITPATAAAHAARSGWDFTAAHYAAGAHILTGERPRQFFLVVRTDAPHLGFVMRLDNAFCATADMRRNIALDIWARCLATNIWPGYPSETIVAELPEWHERNLIAAKDAEGGANAAAILSRMAHWQAPLDWRETGEVVE